MIAYFHRIAFALWLVAGCTTHAAVHGHRPASHHHRPAVNDSSRVSVEEPEEPVDASVLLTVPSLPAHNVSDGSAPSMDYPALPELSLQFDASPLVRRSIDNSVILRILPLGASIVYGLTSSDGNGFRYALRNQLVYGSNPVNFIGSVQSGTMADNDVEGWPGYVITQVASKAELSIPSQPNLVLLHVGTNDCVQNIDIANAGARLGSLIDRLFSAIPDVTIIASTLLPNGNSATQANIQKYNSQIPGVVQSRQSAGKKILYVDFSSSWFSLSDIGSDGTHPTDAGYLKMADVWYQGIQAADSKGWFTTPKTISGVSDTISPITGRTCNKVPGSSIGPEQTQMGSGSDDGAYAHIGVQLAGFAGFNNPSTVNFNNPLPEGVFWADIDGDGTDDYVYVGSNSNYGLGVALSLGGGKFGDYLYFTFANSCNRQGVHFADMTGDGRSDFCCLGPDGGLVCWQNTKGSDARSPNWVSMGTVKSSEGYPQAQVRLADIDGDGRTDYVVFDASTSNIYGWRNGALTNSAPAYWYAMDGVFSGLPGGYALSGWRFVDLNGDKKDDLIWVDPNGQVTTWINRRGFKIGLSPEWVSHGITHGGSGTPVNVTFGKFMGSGRADYALGSIKNGNVWVDRWENQDHGGTMVRGDGSFYCDMTGSGSDDYLFISASGDITLFENQHNWGYWNPWGVIYSANRMRQEIHLADFNGDGRCDILLVDKSSGATNMIRNDFGSGKFSWTDLGTVTGSATCTEGYGTDKHDRGVRWHDLDADGRADYLCITSDGVVSGYLNKGTNNMVNQGMIKHTEGKERKNLRFADINGDGRTDFNFVDMLNGSVTTWYNGGAIPSSGSAFQWNWQGVLSPGGSCRGQCVEFGALYGLGRADYIIVDPSTNKAWTWFNVCPGGIGPTTPNLPSGAPAIPTIVSGDGTDPGNGDDGDDGGDGVDLPWETNAPCDFTIEYASLDDIANDVPNVGSYCAAISAIYLMIDMLGDALDEYADTSNGYDSKFDTYQSYIKSLVPEQIDMCMVMPFAPIDTGPCNQYFSCSKKQDGTYTPCPLKGYNTFDEESWDIYYRLDDEEGFYTELENTYGISRDWVEFPEVKEFDVVCVPTSGAPCPLVAKEAWNYPQAKQDYDIPNPKDVFTSASNNLNALYWDMTQMWITMTSGGWNGTVDDAASVLILPVTMATVAADAMNQVVVTADKIDDEKRKALILEIIGAVLLVIPLAGELAGAAGGLIATLGRIAIVASNAGQVGLSIYDIVDDPSSAPMAIIGILTAGLGHLGGAFSKGSRDIEDMAGALNKADATVLAKLGQAFKDNQAKIGKIAPACKH